MEKLLCNTKAPYNVAGKYNNAENKNIMQDAFSTNSVLLAQFVFAKINFLFPLKKIKANVKPIANYCIQKIVYSSALLIKDPENKFMYSLLYEGSKPYKIGIPN